MKYKSTEDFHNHLLEAIEIKRCYHLNKFEEKKSDEDKGQLMLLPGRITL